MSRRTRRSPRTYPLFPYPTLFRSAGLILGGEDPLPGPGAVVVGVVRGRPRIAGQVPVLAEADRSLSGLRVGGRGAIEVVPAHRDDVGRGLGQRAVGVEGGAGFGVHELRYLILFNEVEQIGRAHV